jgi:hypothetical protein
MRTRAAIVLAEMRQRVEAGEAGDISWWDWFDQNVQRNRRDAEKLLKIASAEDPEAAAEEERRKAREGMDATRKRRAANVSHRWKREKVEREIQSYDSQVKDYILAIKTFDRATAVAMTALRKFSPEARPFTIRKLRAALAHAERLMAALGESEADQCREHNGVNGRAA